MSGSTGEMRKQIAEEGTLRGQTVLIVDDETEVRASLSDYFRAQGLEVFEATDGLDALAQVKKRRPNAVVLDLMMPRLGGLDALKRIRAFDPTITIHVISGFVDHELRQQALSNGAATVLDKPLDFSALLSAVRGLKLDHERADAEPPASTVSAETADHATGSPVQILVVDDNEEICSLLSEHLTRQGYAVRVAEDGAIAVREVVKQAPDVVLLDINMPVLGGLEALTAIRAIAPNVAVIIVSGQLDLERAKRSLAYGAFDYITKPFGLPYLIETIETAMLSKESEE